MSAMAQAALITGVDQALRRRRQPVDVAARLIEHLELEPAEQGQSLDARRRERRDDPAGNGE